IHIFFLSCSVPPLPLHSFPTRRSSDLAVPYATSTGRRFIFLGARTEGKALQGLFVAKYDLDSRRWSEDPIPLDVKIADSAWPDFSVVVSQRSGEDARPHLILCGPTGDLYERELNGEGTDWAGSWSQLEQLPSSQAVLAALEPQSGSDLYLFTSGFNDAI